MFVNVWGKTPVYEQEIFSQPRINISANGLITIPPITPPQVSKCLFMYVHTHICTHTFLKYTKLWTYNCKCIKLIQQYYLSVLANIPHFNLELIQVI